MFSKFVFALCLVALTSLPAQTQETDLQRLADALDVSTTRTFQFTANGADYSLGQNTSPVAPWPRRFVKSLTRVYDFTAGAMRDEWVRMDGGDLNAGPEQRSVQLVEGDYGWRELGKKRSNAYLRRRIGAIRS